jgi:SAM-dependent methyltransferase
MIRHRLNGQPRDCPCCGTSSSVSRIQRKKIFVDILRCGKCRLIFRWPTDTPEELSKHYDSEYAEEAPQVQLPQPQELQKLMDSDFTSMFGDLKDKFTVLKAMKPTGRVLDYGCSWGYATYLLRKIGYDAVGFEVSKPRAEYGRKNLGVTVINSLAELEALPSNSFDIVYSNHVLEHVPSICKTLALFGRLLGNDGLAFQIVPNFTGSAARSGRFLEWIGEDHPIAPTVDFFQLALPAAGLEPPSFASSPFDEKVVVGMTGRSEHPMQLDGDELLVVSQKLSVK